MFNWNKPLYPLPDMPETYPHAVYDDSRSWLQYLKKLASYLNDIGSLTKEMQDYLNNFINEFDENLYNNITDILNKWLEDGILTELVNNSLLQNYVTKNYFDDIVSKINYGIVDDLAKPEDLYTKYPTGVNGIVLVDNSTGGKDFWYYSIINGQWENGGIFNKPYIPDFSIDKIKLDFKVPDMVDTYNLFDTRKIEDGVYYSTTSGAIGYNEDFFSIAIPVKPNTTYKINHVDTRYTRIDVLNYSSTNIFLGSSSASDGVGEWTTPPLATKTILTISKPLLPETCVYLYDGSYKPYIPTAVILSKQIKNIGEGIYFKELDRIKIAGRDVSLHHTKNIIDFNNVLDNKYVDYSTGKINKNELYETFSITLEGNEIYHNINYQFALFDNNNNYLVGFDGTKRKYDLSSYPNAKVLVGCYEKTNKDMYIMCYTSSETGLYEKSVDLITDENIINNTISKNKIKEPMLSGIKPYNIYTEDDLNKGFVYLQNGSIARKQGFGYTVTRNLKAGDVVSFLNASSQGCFFTEEGDYVSGYLDKTEVEIPVGATILVASHYLNPSVPNEMYLGKKPLFSQLNKVMVDPTAIKNQSIERSKLTFPIPAFNESENLINPDDVVNGKYISERGLVGINENYSYILLKLDKSKSKIFFNHPYQGHFYDENMVSVGGYPNNTNPVDIPYEAYYIGITIYNAWNDTMASYDYMKPYSPYKITLNADNISGFEQVERFLTVGKNGVYQTITEAVQSVTNTDKTLIVILPGVYNESVDLRNKNIILFGFDKNSTVIQNNFNDYEKPPLNLSGSNNGVYHLTVKALKNSTSGANKPYAIHIDAQGLTENNEETIVSDCYCYSDTNAGVGIGTRNKQTIRIEHSKLESGAEGAQALYAHNYQLTGAENEKLEFIDLELINNRIGISTVVIQDANYRNGGSADNKKDTTVFFKGCSTYNYASSNTNDITVDTPLDENSFSGYIKLIPYSFGNLATKLNA